MLVVMQSHATPVQIDRVLEAIREMGLTPHAMPGATRTAIGITGNTGTVDSRTLEVLPGVMELIRVTKPYKLASREMHAARHRDLPSSGNHRPGRAFTLIAGPCSVENEAMILRTAELLMAGASGSCGPARSSRGPARTRSRAWAWRAWRSSAGPASRPASASSPS